MSWILHEKEFLGYIAGNTNGQRRRGQVIHCKCHFGRSSKRLIWKLQAGEARNAVARKLGSPQSELVSSKWWHDITSFYLNHNTGSPSVAKLVPSLDHPVQQRTWKVQFSNQLRKWSGNPVCKGTQILWIVLWWYFLMWFPPLRKQEDIEWLAGSKNSLLKTRPVTLESVQYQGGSLWISHAGPAIQFGHCPCSSCHWPMQAISWQIP